MSSHNKFRAPRIWSNTELEKFSDLLTGDILNVSGWKDEDKEGRVYRDYFKNARSYSVSNYISEHRGFTGTLKNEFFLDLLEPLNDNLLGRYDAVFNHTVLEHIFDVRTAFSNLCALSRDLIIVIVPFMQEEHADYGDFWRFTPQAGDQLFRANSVTPLYLNHNDNRDSSIYVFCVGSKHPSRWPEFTTHRDNKIKNIYKKEHFIGKSVFGRRRKGLLKFVNRKYK